MPVFRPGEFVQLGKVGAECSLGAGGVYQVKAVDEKGSLHFERCDRPHCPKSHGAIRIPLQDQGQRFLLAFRVLRVANPTDHDCTLVCGRSYRLDEVDDFHRLRFYHQGCDYWHDPQHFIQVLERGK